jgi:hypothetical protein
MKIYDIAKEMMEKEMSVKFDEYPHNLSGDGILDAIERHHLKVAKIGDKVHCHTGYDIEITTYGDTVREAVIKYLIGVPHAYEVYARAETTKTQGTP